MKQMVITLLLAIIITAIGVRMFQTTLEPTLVQGHERLMDRYQNWGYSDE
jgi:cell division protein FtsL